MARIGWFIGAYDLKEEVHCDPSINPQVADGAGWDDFIWTAFSYDLDHGGLGNELIFGTTATRSNGDIVADPSQPRGSDFIPATQIQPKWARLPGNGQY